jgi:hypothetical protein
MSQYLRNQKIYIKSAPGPFTETVQTSPNRRIHILQDALLCYFLAPKPALPFGFPTEIL